MTCFNFENSNLIIKRILTFLFELRNCILDKSLVWSLFFSIQVYASLNFVPISLENFFFFSPRLSVFFTCSVFWIWCHIQRLFVTSILGALWFVMTLQKLITFQMSYYGHNKKHASKEVLNSGNFIFKQKRGALTKWKSEMFYQKKNWKNELSNKNY